MQISIIQSCQKAREAERRGEYEEARELLGGFEMGSWPETAPLAVEVEAELLLRQGSVTACLASASALPEAQEHARNLLTAAQELFFKAGSQRKRAECFNRIAVSYWCEGRTKEALAYADTSLVYTQEESGEERAAAFLIRAIVFKSSNRYEDAVAECRLAAPLVALLKSDYISGIYHQTLGNIHKALAENESRPELFDLAITHNTSASIHFEACGHRRYQTRAETTLGNLYRATGMLPEAERHLLHAKRIAHDLRDVSLEGQIDDSIAKLYAEQGRTIEAERAVRQAIRRLEETGERLLLAEAYETLAKVLRMEQ